jgi:rubrerythrin
MTTVDTQPKGTLSQQHLGLLMQYTVEAYKTFQKLAENLPNPMVAIMFKQFAEDEREARDLIEMKIAAVQDARVRVTLGGDLLFQDILEGSLSYRETAEFLISRERTMEKKLNEWRAAAGQRDRNFLTYLIASKKAHVVELERELEMIKVDSDWFRREDAEWRIIHGAPAE